MYQAQRKIHPHYPHTTTHIITTHTEETIYYTQSVYKTKGVWLFNTSSHTPAILLYILALTLTLVPFFTAAQLLNIYKLLTIKSWKMFREAAVAALGLASASAFKLAEEAVSVLQKRDGAHAHEHTDSGYGAPPATYEEPAASYGAPAPTYEEPASGYGAPAPSYGYEEEPLPDLTPIIVGILVLTGLSLLFPTFVSLATVRRKRHAEDGKQKHILEREAWPAHSVEQPRP